MGAVAPLLNLASSGSDAINKVAVAHLWPCWPLSEMQILSSNSVLGETVDTKNVS